MHCAHRETLITSRRQSEATETRSVFSSTIHHAYVVHIQEMSYFFRTLGMASRQSFAGSFPFFAVVPVCHPYNSVVWQHFSVFTVECTRAREARGVLNLQMREFDAATQDFNHALRVSGYGFWIYLATLCLILICVLRRVNNFVTA